MALDIDCASRPHGRVDVIVQLRPVRAEDVAFLRALRAVIDGERLALHAWPTDPATEKLKQTLLDQQYAQHTAHYLRLKEQQDVRDCVMEFEGRLVGYLIVTADTEKMHLADIGVHPDFRRRGIGRAAIALLQHECRQSARPLQLHVEKWNTAQSFYLRLGFMTVGELPTHYTMRWEASMGQGLSV